MFSLRELPTSDDYQFKDRFLEADSLMKSSLPLRQEMVSDRFSTITKLVEYVKNMQDIERDLYLELGYYRQEISELMKTSGGMGIQTLPYYSESENFMPPRLPPHKDNELVKDRVNGGTDNSPRSQKDERRLQAIRLTIKTLESKISRVSHLIRKADFQIKKHTLQSTILGAEARALHGVK